MSFCVGENEWVILTLPDGCKRLAQTGRGALIDFGRFGKFQADSLIGKQYGTYWKVLPDGQLCPTSPPSQGAPVEEITATNQTLSDTNTSQRLTTQDIEELKAQVSSGNITAEQVVQTLIEGSETFSGKNAYSQIKYVQRKQRKFSRWFILQEVTPRTLSAYFMSKDPRKIMDLRLDVLSQIICLSNIGATGSRTLVWDETNGFLTSCLLTRMTPTSLLVHVHPDRQMQAQSLMYFNFSSFQRSRLIPWPIASFFDCEDLIEEDEEKVKWKEPDPERRAIQMRRKEEKQARKQLVTNLITNSRFDALIIATNRHEPLEILQKVSSALRPSAKIIIYSSWRELLLPSYVALRKDSTYLDVFGSETWMRPYQAAPGRIHPHMTCNGHSGLILSATRIGNSTL